MILQIKNCIRKTRKNNSEINKIKEKTSECISNITKILNI